jgi:flavoprotein hydroxylase
VVGVGWQLLFDADAGDPSWSPEQADFAASIHLRIVRLVRPTAGDAHRGALPSVVVDLAGQALDWLKGQGLAAALVRPDFYTFGGAAAAADIGPLLDQLQRQLRPSLKVSP